MLAFACDALDARLEIWDEVAREADFDTSGGAFNYFSSFATAGSGSFDASGGAGRAGGAGGAGAGIGEGGDGSDDDGGPALETFQAAGREDLKPASFALLCAELAGLSGPPSGGGGAKGGSGGMRGISGGVNGGVNTGWARHRTTLTALDLSSNPHLAGTLALFAPLASLKKLSCAFCPRLKGPLGALLQAPLGPSGSAGAAAAATATSATAPPCSMPHLTHLLLGHTSVGGNIASAAAFLGLRVLDLHRTRVGGDIGTGARACLKFQSEPFAAHAFGQAARLSSASEWQQKNLLPPRV